MESKNIQRVTFAELADVKLFLVLIADNAESKWSAYKQMSALGMRPNSGAMTEARRDITETLGLYIAVTEEFRRLHVGCECPTTNEEIEDGIKELKSKLAEIEKETADAGPVDTDPGHAIADLRTFLGAVGMQVPEGFDRKEIPGMSTGDGTGFYF